MRGAVGQPQLRGPHPCARARQLSRVAAAGRRLRAGRQDRPTISPPSRSATGNDGKPVYLQATSGRRNQEIDDTVAALGRRATCSCERYGDVFEGPPEWQRDPSDRQHDLPVGGRLDLSSELPPYFEGMHEGAGAGQDVSGARVLAIFGDSITTDHISPGRLIRSEQPGRRIPDRAIRCARWTSTPTARAAATTKS